MDTNPAVDYVTSMDLEFLGGAREVGRSALLVDDTLLIDYGQMTADPPQYPVRDPEPGRRSSSHTGHLDHVGAVPALLKGDRRPTVHWTVRRPGSSRGRWRVTR